MSEKVTAEPKSKGAKDIERFYYRKSACASKRSSLSLDTVLVRLLAARFGNMKKLRKWVGAQAKIANEAGLDAKSISRAVQENAIRLIADPDLIKALPRDEASEAERQRLLAQSLGQGRSVSSSRSRQL